MPLAVDLYHPMTGKHKRVIVDTVDGDVAAETASRMYPALHVRAVVPAPDVSAPEVRLPPGAAARFDGAPVDIEYQEFDLGAATAPTVVADAPVARVSDTQAAPTPAKRKAGRPVGSKNRPKQVVEAELAAEQAELMRGPSVARPDTTNEPV